MDVKQEPFDPNTETIKMEPDFVSDQMNGNNWCSTKDKTFKNDQDCVLSDTDNCENQTTSEFLSFDEIKQECDLPKIKGFDFLENIEYESVRDNVNNFPNTIKKEPENANEIKAADIDNIKPVISEISEYVQLKLENESELLTSHCDLPTLKSEVEDYSNHFAQPCSSKLTIIKSKSSKHTVRNVPKQKKRGYPWSVFQKTFRSPRQNQFGSCYEICYYCGQFFLNKSQFLSHFIIFHYVNKATKVCNRKFRHYKNCRCKNCLRSIFRHQPTTNIFHFNEKLFQCKICSKTFPTKRNLNNHLKVHTGKKCEICLKQFTRKSKLELHLIIHTGEKPFKCEICSKQFNQKSNLNSHLKLHKGEKPFKCEICSKQFVYKCDLNRHLQIHTNKKPYKCEICSKQFAQNTNLKRHLKIHNGEKLFKCEKCFKKFHKRLESHLKICTGEKPFQCEKCPKRFGRRQHLKSHLLIHSGEKTFKCEICSKRFTRKGDLKRHLKIHTEEKPYKCKICSNQFAQEAYLKRHFKIHNE